MSNCPNCGSIIYPQDKFCNSCGAYTLSGQAENVMVGSIYRNFEPGRQKNDILTYEDNSPSSYKVQSKKSTTLLLRIVLLLSYIEWLLFGYWSVTSFRNFPIVIGFAVVFFVLFFLVIYFLQKLSDIARNFMALILFFAIFISMFFFGSFLIFVTILFQVYILAFNRKTVALFTDDPPMSIK